MSAKYLKDTRFEVGSFFHSASWGFSENGVRQGRAGSEDHHRYCRGACSFRTSVTTQDNVNFHVWISAEYPMLYSSIEYLWYSPLQALLCCMGCWHLTSGAIWRRFGWGKVEGAKTPRGVQAVGSGRIIMNCQSFSLTIQFLSLQNVTCSSHFVTYFSCLNSHLLRVD